MHGRIKTISTEEQKIKQKKAREVKQQVYTAAMALIFKKRSQEEYDDEALAVTREVLLANPDIITLWNYRREIFLFRKKELGEDELEISFKHELSLTEQCLRVNPKSYGTWHYRVWVLDNMPSSNWDKEVDLCNKYISLDERNFHCWDYRKLVVERASVPALDEYNFTTKKIENNFSNYSAWHYRSKLLPKIFEDPEGKFTVAEEKHKEELKLVQNAAFTDPDDQSAWFYQRWLLGLRNPAISFIVAQVSSKVALVALSREIRLGHSSELMVCVNDNVAAGKWSAASGTATSDVWTFYFSEEVPEEAVVLIVLQSSTEKNKIFDKIEVKSGSSTKILPSFSPLNSVALKLTLEEQLKSCQDLLDLEPDSKWTLLTSILLMKSLDLTLYTARILSALENLTSLDLNRAGYYRDLYSQIHFELQILSTPFSDTFVMCNNRLTSLYHTQYLVLTEKVDLSGNKLTNCSLKQLYPLVNCTSLILDSNLLTNVSSLPLLINLKCLSVKNNPLICLDKDQQYLKQFSNLKIVTFL